MPDNTTNIQELESLTDQQVNTFEDANNVSKLDMAEALQELSLKFKQEELESRKQDREQRRHFAKDILWVVVAYLAVVLVIVFFNGFRLTDISDTVLITLLGTTTANVIALLVIVVNYLFHTKE